MQRLLGCALAATLLAGGATAAFAEWPERPIQIIVPYGAGGGSDATVRLFQRVIEEEELLPQPLAVINIPGAGGRTGSRRVVEAEPDGYTILSNHLTLLSSEASGLADFGHEDYEPVASTGGVCFVTIVPESAPYETLSDLLDDAAERPGEIVFGANLGAMNHLGGLLLQDAQEGASFRFVQIGGDAANYTAVAGGTTQASVISTGQYKASGGRGIKALGLLAEERHPEMPDVPTAMEQDVDAQFCYDYWWLAPAGTPNDAVDTMADALEAAMESDRVKEAFRERAYTDVFRRGEAFKDFIAQEYERIAPVAVRATQAQ